MARPLRLCWAVSGQGRALLAVLEAMDRGLLRVEIAAVVTDRASPIEGTAAARDLPCYQIMPEGGPYHPRLVEALARHDADWLGLTFNRLLSDAVIKQMGGRIFNLHLSLLPMFPGFGAIGRALVTGMRLTGATVHLIDGRVDGGTILGQVATPVLQGDTREALGRRLFESALPLLLQVVRSAGEGEFTVGPNGSDWPRASRLPVAPGLAFPEPDPDLVRFARRFCAGLPMD